MSDGGISDNEIVAQTGREVKDNTHGWSSLGQAFGSGFNSTGTAGGENAYENGMRIGAQTADALAQAKQRVQTNDANNKAADMLEGPEGELLGLSPPLRSLGATQLRAGRSFGDVVKDAVESLHLKNRTKIADPNAPENDRVAAAASEVPGDLMPKPVGTLGSVFRPAANNGQGSVAMSPLATQFTESGMALKGAQTSVVQQNADANTKKADAAAAAAGQGHGGGKPPTGYRWKLDENHNPTDTLEFMPGGPSDPSTPKEGAYSRVYHENMLGSAQGATTELKNLMDLGPSESVGLSNAKGGKGLLGALSTDMGRAMSSTQQQMVHKSFANLGRYIATVENGGRPPPSGVTTPLQDTLESLPTDTHYSRAYGLALARQDLEAQRSRMANSSAAPAIKSAFEDTLTQLQKAVPFTPQDVRDWSRSNSPSTLMDWMKKKSAPAAGGAVDLGNGWSVTKH